VLGETIFQDGVVYTCVSYDSKTVLEMNLMTTLELFDAAGHRKEIHRHYIERDFVFTPKFLVQLKQHFLLLPGATENRCM
jgi:hypothetical protein